MDILNILDWLARPLLNRWKAARYEPSFRITYAFGAAKREKMPDGTIVIRRSSSLYGVDETLLQKFFRLLRRFSHLESMFKSLGMSDEELLKRSFRHETYENSSKLRDSSFTSPTTTSPRTTTFIAP
jgi:hypothetical protein